MNSLLIGQGKNFGIYSKCDDRTLEESWSDLHSESHPYCAVKSLSWAGRKAGEHLVYCRHWLRSDGGLPGGGD